MAARPRTARRRWSETFKKRVVAEASESGVTVTQLARRYDLDARRVSNWMKKFSSGVALVPVEVTSDDSGSPTSATIEVDLPCGTRLRCGPETSAELVTTVIAALRSKR
jgi:transposase-like protein